MTIKFPISDTLRQLEQFCVDNADSRVPLLKIVSNELAEVMFTKPYQELKPHEMTIVYQVSLYVVQAANP